MKQRSVFTWLLLIFLAVFSLSELILFLFMDLLLKGQRAGQVYPSPTLLTEWIIFAGLSVAVAVFSVLIVLFIGKRRIRPLKELTDAIKRVANGDYAVTLSPYAGKDEIGLLIDCFDVMLKKLKATETMRNEFMASVSHEFRTPLALVAGNAQLLTSKDDMEARCIAVINSETQRLSSLCDDMLLLARLEAEDQVPQKQEYRLDEQIRNVIIVQERAWSAKALEFDLDFPRALILGNESLLYQVWTNLISNAIKYADVGSTIRMTLAQRERTSFTIENAGVPLTEEQLTHLFDQFYQARPSYSGEGSGYGLAIAKKIVECHGGQIWAERKDEITRLSVVL